MVLCLAAAMLFSGAFLFAQEEAPSLADKVSFALEFGASIISADSEGVVDSLTDAGFNEDETKIGLAYEDELWGASASLKFGTENLRHLNGEIGEMFADFPLALDELYGWVKPFGSWFKFTGGIFENTDGVADYTDDIDDFSMGVFVFGAGGEPYTEPEEVTGAALTNGFLTDAVFGPLTLQFLLAPNYSKESASELVSDLLSQMAGQDISVDTEERFFRLGGRVIFDAGVGTVSALYKVFQWPIEFVNAMMGESFPGSLMTYNTFGIYFDFTAVENLGLSLGYTGFLPLNNGSDVENVLYSGIDLRATWTGIEGLSLSTHHNVSFAKGAEKDWLGSLGKDASFLTLYNAIGGTKELTDKFSVNAEIGNVFSTTDDGNSGKIEFESFMVAAKLITRVGENVEFDAGLEVVFEKNALSGGYGDEDENLTVFSVPIGIIISF
jgi:hypothetical protein